MKLVVLVLDADWSVQYSSCTKVHDIFTVHLLYNMKLLCISMQHRKETTVTVYVLVEGWHFTIVQRKFATIIFLCRNQFIKAYIKGT